MDEYSFDGKKFNSMGQMKLYILVKEELKQQFNKFAESIGETKENFVNMLYRNKYLNVEKVVSISYKTRIDIAYFLDDEIEYNLNARENYKITSDKIVELEGAFNKIEMKLKKINDMLIKNNDEVSILFAKDLDIISKALAETTIYYNRINRKLTEVLKEDVYVSSSIIKSLSFQLQNLLNEAMLSYTKFSIKIINTLLDLSKGFNSLSAYKSYKELLNVQYLIDKERNSILELEQFIKEVDDIIDINNFLVNLEGKINEMVEEINSFDEKEIRCCKHMKEVQLLESKVEYDLVTQLIIYLINKFKSFVDNICLYFKSEGYEINNQIWEALKREFHQAVIDEEGEFALFSYGETLKNLYSTTVKSIGNSGYIIDKAKKQIIFRNELIKLYDNVIKELRQKV